LRIAADDERIDHRSTLGMRGGARTWRAAALKQLIFGADDVHRVIEHSINSSTQRHKMIVRY
jgi:hypothetical protein